MNTEAMTAPNTLMRRWGPLVPLILLTVLAFGIRVATTQFVTGGLSGAPFADETQYYHLGVSLAAGKGYTSPDGTAHIYRSPGVPFLLAPLLAITGPSVMAGRAYMCALNSLLVPICFLLGGAAAGRRVAWLSALAAVFMPNWVFFSGSLLSDLPTAAAVAMTAWLALEGGRRGSMPTFLAAGFALGATVLIRPSCMVFLPILCVWLLVAPGLQHRRRGLLLIGLPFVLLIGTWVIRNSLVTGEYVGLSTQGGHVLWKSNNPHANGILNDDDAFYYRHISELYPRERYASESQRSAALAADAKRFIRENPGRFLRLCGIKFVQLWKVYSPRVSLGINLMTLASFGVLLPFAVLQMFGFAWRRSPEMLFTLLIAAQTAVHCVYTAIARYRMPVEPLVVVMAMAGLCWAYDRVRTAGKQQPVADASV